MVPGVDQQRLAGGVNEVVRIGSLVHRPGGAWTPAVHDLLRYVRRRGFTGAPSVHGFDEHGRERLDFIDGQVPSSSYAASADGLHAAGALLRSFHDATVGFDVGGPWYFPAREPAEVICHGDVAPYNTVFRDGRPVAFIDFDTAHPGPRVWDVGYAAYRFVPLLPSTASLPARLDAFLSGYGMEFPTLFPVAIERLEALCAHMIAAAAAGNAAFAGHIAAGHLQIYQDSIAFLRTRTAHH